MGQTRTQYIDGVTVLTTPLPYPRYIGEVLQHPFLQNTLLEVLQVWDGTIEVWGNLSEPIPFAYGSESNPVTRDWNTPPPRRDESSKYPIYKCRVNGANEQWIIFKWILLDENKPTDLLGYSGTQVASGNAMPQPPVAPNLPAPVRRSADSFSLPLSFADSSYILTPSGDPDADAVITAIEATGVALSSTQLQAIQDRVVNAKADGAWTKWIAYYGFVGGTAAAHSINWKSPGTFNITWNGTLTHNANGVKGNGSTGYGNLGINPSTQLSYTACGLGFYYTEPKVAAATIDCGSQVTTNIFSLESWDDGNNYFEVGTFINGAINTGKHYLSGSKIGATATIYVNGASTATGTPTGSLPNANLAVFCMNNSGVFETFSAARLGSLCVNTGLTSGEEAANYVSELAFQTALGRN